MTKEIPILFSTAMVQAILDGRKTETRREVSRYNSKTTGIWDNLDFNDIVHDGKGTTDEYLKAVQPSDNTRHRVFARIKSGDVLWVRESWNITDPDEAVEGEVLGPRTYYEGIKAGKPILWQYVYKASSPSEHPIYGKAIWKPSIHMPKAAARIWLEVTEVKVERLQDITEDSARAEGIEKKMDDISVGLLYRYYTKANHWCNSAIASFGSLWEKINGKASLDANPWVWVLKFKVLSTTGKPSQLITNP